MNTPSPIAEDTRTLVITRTLNAPRSLVWKMFSDPFHLAQSGGAPRATPTASNSSTSAPAAAGAT
jgi:uncharacterized protein YndB with AHSA1/START domain